MMNNLNINSTSNNDVNLLNDLQKPKFTSNINTSNTSNANQSVGLKSELPLERPVFKNSKK